MKEKASFIECYNAKRREFEDSGDFVVILPKNEPIVWPNSSGVYVVWEKNRLLYIGMRLNFLDKRAMGV